MMPLSNCLVCLQLLFGTEGSDAVTQAVSAEFAVHDQNGDGVWTRRELTSSADVAAFLATDHNGDFRIPLAEYLVTATEPTNPMWKAFLQTDANHNGVIERAEFVPAQGEAAVLAAAEAEFIRFDRDANGRLDVAEFLGTSRSGLSANARFLWMDADEDGHILESELAQFYAKSHAIHARLEWWFCGRESFPDIRLEDWLRRDTKRTRSAENEFWLRDADTNQQMTLDEYAAWEYGAIKPATRQTFVMFDFDQNGTLRLGEYRAIPGAVPEAERVVPDPIQTAYESVRDKLRAVLRDTKLEEWTEATWPVMKLADAIGPLSLRAAGSWDLDKNGTITLAEVERCLRGGYGLDTWSEPPLSIRRNQSQVFNQTYYDSIDQDRDGRMSKAEFIKRYHLGAEGNQKVFAEIDANADEFIDLKEILAGAWFLTNTVNEYRRLDLDLDGRVSPEEFDKQTYAWHQSLKAQVFPAFDQNRDGFLSLLEFRATPAANQVMDWFRSQQDTDGSGALTFDEFLAPTAGGPPLRLALLRLFVFERFDRNSDQRLDPQEFPFSVNLAALTAEAAFQHRDKDRNKGVSWEELSAGLAVDRHPALRQLFVVFDANNNQQLEFAEFRALPDVVKPADRIVPDSVRNERDRFLGALTTALGAADRNQNGKWSRDEWPVKATLLPMLMDQTATAFQAWDFDRNGEVTAEELAAGADLAFGLIDPLERKWPWHHSNGTVFSGYNWRNYDKNRDHIVSREEFLAAYHLKGDEAEKRFREIDHDQNGTATAPEMFVSNWMMTNVLNDFLRFDADRNGQLTRDELLTSLEVWRKKQGEQVFPGFDTNGDGHLTLAEYRLTTLSNPVINWGATQTDRNGDGLIDVSEFFPERLELGPLWLCGLMPMVFHHLDHNHDGRLDETEYDFQGKLLPQLSQPGWGPDPVRAEYERALNEFRGWLSTGDRNHDGQLAENEWPRPEVERLFPLKELHSFAVWDGNIDGRVSLDEFQSILRQVWGITSRRCPHDWLRQASGHVVDFNTFVNVDVDGNGQLSRQEFIEKFYGTPVEREKWFPEIDQDKDGAITIRELVGSGRLKWSPWDNFQKLDSNHDGKLSAQELALNVPSWQKALAAKSFPAFDGDRDGFLSPSEFRWTPLANPLITWTNKRTDTDNNGVLSLDEFYTRPAGESSYWLLLLAYEHFRRYDRNHDGRLTLDEQDFSVDVSRLDPVAAFRYADKNHDGGLSPDEAFRDAKPDGKNPAAVIDFHRRKMRSEEAFLGADSDRDRLLNQSEYAKYHSYMQGTGVAKQAAPKIPPARGKRSWEEVLAYGFTGVNLLLAIVGGVYWVLKRRSAQ